MQNSKYDIITILGATAGGKTSLATNIAYKLNGEIISADSRQVYKGMDIGTGKDLEDYEINNIKIPYHLIDIVDAGEKYNVFEYQKDFLKVYEDIKKRNKLPILSGGTGMYIDAVLKGYKLINVPHSEELKNELEKK
ncbi:MAG: tRNA (adenosine(37)-N6)-dimethylallyltransferase MiaA, partial [Chlorobi bacterium]|nr:tRNA (adenosine(37)-N6)-dimethylallyltransferase MiaA [Chlorobiota bacterium]